MKTQRLVKDNSLAARAVSVPCIAEGHQGHIMVPLHMVHADLNGRAFVDYYCDVCLARQGVVI